MSADDDAWARFFDERGIDALELVYEEDVVPDPEGSVRRVADVVGVALPPDWAPDARTVRQSDELSDNWYETYHQDAPFRVR